MTALPLWAQLLAFPIAFTFAAFAAARLTQLVTTDSITETPRVWVTERADRRRITRPIAILINCGWCVSVWVAGAVAGLDALAAGPFTVVIALLYPGSAVIGWLLVIAALALAAGMLATRTR
jgi:hypothetical protein